MSNVFVEYARSNAQGDAYFDYSYIVAIMSSTSMDQVIKFSEINLLMNLQVTLMQEAKNERASVF